VLALGYDGSDPGVTSIFSAMAHPATGSDQKQSNHLQAGCGNRAAQSRDKGFRISANYGGGFVDDAPTLFSDLTKLQVLKKFLHRSGSPD